MVHYTGKWEAVDPDASRVCPTGAVIPPAGVMDHPSIDRGETGPWRRRVENVVDSGSTHWNPKLTLRPSPGPSLLTGVYPYLPRKVLVSVDHLRVVTIPLSPQ